MTSSVTSYSQDQLYVRNRAPRRGTLPEEKHFT